MTFKQKFPWKKIQIELRSQSSNLKLNPIKQKFFFVIARHHSDFKNYLLRMTIFQMNCSDASQRHYFPSYFIKLLRAETICNYLVYNHRQVKSYENFLRACWCWKLNEWRNSIQIFVIVNLKRECLLKNAELEKH